MDGVCGFSANGRRPLDAIGASGLFDLGGIFNPFTLFFVPIWRCDGDHFCLMIDSFMFLIGCQDYRIAWSSFILFVIYEHGGSAFNNIEQFAAYSVSVPSGLRYRPVSF